MGLLYCNLSISVHYLLLVTVTLQEPQDLKDMMMKVFREGLEGLVLKDVNVRKQYHTVYISSWKSRLDIHVMAYMCINLLEGSTVKYMSKTLIVGKATYDMKSLLSMTSFQCYFSPFSGCLRTG